MSSARTSGRRRKRTKPLSGAGRVRVVWVSLMGAMTAVGGLLLLAEDRPAVRNDGLTLPALVAAGTGTNIESVLQTRSPLDRARWTHIVVHHSGSAFGSPASIEAEHQALNFRGLGHHFLIGNGAGMDDGELHVGYRWLDQLPGAHAGGVDADAFNLHAISVCLVGDGDRREFTPAQLKRLDQLLATLVRELGIPAESVVVHADIAPTTDPGRLFPKAWLSERIAQYR